MIALNGRAIEVGQSKGKKKPIIVVKSPAQAQGFHNRHLNGDMDGGTYSSHNGELNNNGLVKRNKKFEYAKTDLVAIAKQYMNDSYTQIAINKYVDLIFKRGWFLKSHNPNAKEYIRRRLVIMAKATKQPTINVLKEITHSIVLYANGYRYLVKMPFSEARKFTPVVDSSQDIIVGCFTMHPASMYIIRDSKNNIIKYQQRDIAQARENRRGIHVIPFHQPNGAEWPVYDPEIVMHSFINREPGYAFGLPSVSAVIDDINALRMLEEHAARLIYRELFPLRHVKVGLDQPGAYGSAEEVTAIREEFSMIPYDGLFVSNERVNINESGMKNKALDPSPTLSYYEQRSFTGLGVSSVQMGRDTSNRATADALTTEMHDRAESYQNVISQDSELFFDMLLEEGGFDTMDEFNKVYLEFPELELETIIKKNSDIVNRWINNTMTSEEMRKELGTDKLTEQQIQDLFVNVVSIPLVEAQAAAKAAAQPGTGSKAGTKKSSDNKVRPANQHKKRSGPKRKSESPLDSIDRYIDISCKFLPSLESIQCAYNKLGEYILNIHCRKINIPKKIAREYIKNIFDNEYKKIEKRESGIDKIHSIFTDEIKSNMKYISKLVLTQVAWLSILKTESSMSIEGNCEYYNNKCVCYEGKMTKLIPPHSSTCNCRLVSPKTGVK